VAELATVLTRQTRDIGRYESTAAGVLIPLGQTFATVRLRRPNTALGETVWPTITGRPQSDNHEETNGRVSTFYGGLSTEVARVYLYFSRDGGASWEVCGHVATTGGDVFNRRGDLLLETTLICELPEENNPDRRLQVVLRCRVRLDTECIIDVDARTRPQTQRRSIANSLTLEDTQSASATSASTVSSANITPAANRRYLVVYGGLSDGFPGNYSSITFGASTLTQVFTDVSGYNRISAAAETAPSTTAAACSFTATTSNEGIFVGGLAFSDVDQTTPRDNLSTASNGTTNDTNTVTAGDSVDVRICGFVGEGDTSITVGSGEISRVLITGITAEDLHFLISTKHDGGSDAMNWAVNAGASWIGRGFNMNEDLGSTTGRIMSSLAAAGGLSGSGGIAGEGGGLAG